MATALLLAASTARATPPTPADVETAKAEFSSGLDLRTKGDLPSALTHFKAAFALVPTPITELEVGRTLLGMGHILEGREALLDASHLPHQDGESDKAQQARDEAGRLAEEARARIASVKVEYGGAPAATPVLTIDGVVIPPAAAGAPRMLDPGHHVVVARAAGKMGRAEVDLRDGEQRTVSLTLDQRDPAVRGEGTGHLVPGPLVYIGFSVAGAGLLVGAGTGMAAFITADTVKGECPNGLCPPSAHGDRQASEALGTISTIAFAVGGAGLVAGIVGLLVSHRVPERERAAQATVRLQPWLGPGTLGLSGSF